MRVYTSAGSLEAANHCWIQHSWEDAVYASSIPVSKKAIFKDYFHVNYNDSLGCGRYNIFIDPAAEFVWFYSTIQKGYFLRSLSLNWAVPGKRTQVPFSGIMSQYIESTLHLLGS